MKKIKINDALVKKILVYLGIVVFFVVLSYAFVPQVLSG